MMRKKSHDKRPLRFDIITIGAATQDVFLESENFIIQKDHLAPAGIDACFPMGAKLVLDNVFLDTGGGATNAAVTFARLGFHTAVIGRVGKDLNGEMIRSVLEKDGIDLTCLQTDPKEKTAYSVILLSKEGYRTILNYRGASAVINPKEIPWKQLRTDYIYLTSVGGKKVLLESIFKSVREKNIHVAWNPGSSELALGLKTLTPWILDCDFLSLNREEAAELAGVPPRHIESALHRLGPLPKQGLLVTDGSNGAYVHARGTTWFAKSLKGKRVNTTGAGDAFGSGFIAGAIKTGNLEKALAIAMINAHGVVTHMGAKNGILDRFPNVLQIKRVSIKKI